MNIQFLAIMIPIIALVGTFMMIFYLRKYQNIERMAMIEKGVALDFLSKEDGTSFFAPRRRNTSIPLRLSLLLIGAGLGILTGHLLERNFFMESEVAYFSMLFIFGGVGLGLAYIIEEKKNEKVS